MSYLDDCGYYEAQRLRPYCNKLLREIRPKDCKGCGWYYIPRQEEKSDIVQLRLKDQEEANKIIKRGLENL